MTQRLGDGRLARMDAYLLGLLSVTPPSGIWKKHAWARGREKPLHSREGLVIRSIQEGKWLVAMHSGGLEKAVSLRAEIQILPPPSALMHKNVSLEAQMSR